MSFRDLLHRLNQYVLNPLIALLFVVALITFIYGVLEFLQNRDSDKAEDGKRHILWGLVGMTIMVSVYGILQLIKSLVGSDISLTQ